MEKRFNVTEGMDLEIKKKKKEKGGRDWRYFSVLAVKNRNSVSLTPGSHQ